MGERPASPRPPSSGGPGRRAAARPPAPAGGHGPIGPGGPAGDPEDAQEPQAGRTEGPRPGVRGRPRDAQATGERRAGRPEADGTTSAWRSRARPARRRPRDCVPRGRAVGLGGCASSPTEAPPRRRGDWRAGRPATWAIRPTCRRPETPGAAASWLPDIEGGRLGLTGTACSRGEPTGWCTRTGGSRRRVRPLDRVWQEAAAASLVWGGTRPGWPGWLVPGAPYRVVETGLVAAEALRTVSLARLQDQRDFR